MHTFCQIIHSKIGEEKEQSNLFTISSPFTPLHIENAQSASPRSLITAPEGGVLNVQRCNRTVTFNFNKNEQLVLNNEVVLDMNGRLLKILMIMYTKGAIEYSISSKFSYFKKTISNIFLTETQRETFIQCFYEIQRKYWTLNRAIYKYKFKTSLFRIKKDVFLNPINETQHNVITIVDNNNKYLFTFLDLKNIIESSLSNSQYFVATPIPPKNPYTNLPFNKSTLYNIYFFMKRGSFVMPRLFHNYFLCNFNIKQFCDENEVLLRELHIRDHINNSDIEELYYDVLEMLRKNKFARRLNIDRSFPKKRLVEIMRPYIEIYYRYIYSLNLCDQNSSLTDLDAKLRKFYFFNPKFGRKYIKLNVNPPDNLFFNDECVKFNKDEYSGDFMKSHLEIDDDYSRTASLSMSEESSD
jgi:hypothetical protein